MSLRLDTLNNVLCAAVLNERNSGKIATALLRLAREFDNSLDFKKACAASESYIRSDDAREYKWEDDKLPRAWTQAKSDIAAGMDLGLDPSKYESYAAFKTAKIEVNASLKDVSNADAKDKDGRKDPTVTLVSESKNTGAEMPDDLKGLVGTLSKLPNNSARAVLVKELTRLASMALDMHRANEKEGSRRAGNVKATA